MDIPVIQTSILKTVISLMKDRAQLVEEFVTQAPYFFERPKAYDEKTVRKAWKENSGKLVLAYKKDIARYGSRFVERP